MTGFHGGPEIATESEGWEFGTRDETRAYPRTQTAVGFF
jgi:hypothetical protein